MPAAPGATPPCVLFEDDHLLVVNKPPGWNTHAPSPFAGEGIYDWLRHREPRWASLAIVHRLDKETSGVMVFTKSPQANRSLTQQFERGDVRKTYVLATDRLVEREAFTVCSNLVRAGGRYVARPAGAEAAETAFRVIRRESGRVWLEACPRTGRTHQIRVHAAMEGLPMLGDALYGGSPAARVFLHAGELSFKHPSTEATVTFHAEPDFEAGREVALRRAIVDPDTNTFRVVHGAADGQQGWFVDRLGDCLLSSSEELLDDRRIALLTALTSCTTGRCAYHKTLRFRVGHANVGEASPRLVLGQPAPEFFSIRENGVQFYVSFREGYSAGLFLDQRDNRRRVLNGHVAAGFELAPDAPGGTREVLNTFAYTCGISVCAALARARVTSLDLSKKYLDWGRRNFVLNGLDPAAHDFIHGDCFEWMRRLAKKGRAFDLVLLDPPTFSRSKASGSFSAEKDYGKLVELALPLVKQGGVLFASTNAATLEPEEFLSTVRGAIAKAGRVVDAEHYAPQPPDFPITREEPGHLKTVWLRLT